MTRLRLSLMLLLTALTLGCNQSAAVTSETAQILPAKAPEHHVAQKVVSPEQAVLVIPSVRLSTQHAKWCVKRVGDALLPLELPRLEGERTELTSLSGKRATVVLFWQADRWMSRMALEDLVYQVADKYDPKNVSVVGIPVKLPAREVRRIVNRLKVSFPQLMDLQGDAMAQVGSVALPRIYVLNPSGKIVWFDIEYSESTRRELAQTLVVLTESAE